jgi:hypothetical protein
MAGTPRVNYLNNRDILKEIHLSKNTYCYYTDRINDHQYDIILPSITDINEASIAEAKAERASRLKRDTGVPVDLAAINLTDLVFRISTKAHIPLVPKKLTKSQQKKKLEDYLDADIIDDTDTLDDFDLKEDALNETSANLPTMVYAKINFPAFEHFRFNEHNELLLVGRSHWKGDLDTGAFNKDHGKITNKLALMWMKLCERYATRSNWRNYTYNEEMRGQALLQLSQIGLQFDESKSLNPFAYYTAAITNSFTRVLNIEKKNQNIRDDILVMNNLNPSFSRQISSSDNIGHVSED